VILALDVGNTQIYGGLFDHDSVVMRFRKSSRPPTSADELGLFLRSVMRENGGEPSSVEQIACCSVLPEAIYAVRHCCRKYFAIDPFVLGAGAKTGLKIKYRNPLELGPDRVAAAVAATHLYPGEHLVIVDFGTATTIDAVAATREHLGGLILPGLRIQMESLVEHTARLPTVEIRSDVELLGRSTVECIQAGLYYGSLAAVAGLTREIQTRLFSDHPCRVIATGGFSRLFESNAIFNEFVPDLVLIGLKRALSLNPDASQPWTADD
jgi:type III pantothenate kinase